MRNESIIEGQISIFELPIINAAKPKEITVKKEQAIKSDKLDDIVNLYSDTCSRIVKTVSGALLVEIDNKTLYFNSNGVKEFELNENVGIMPGSEIVIANIDKEINPLQRKKLEELEPKEYIKRKGDANIIIPGEKTIVINPKGWVLEYVQQPKYHQNEIFTTKFISNVNTINHGIKEVSIDIENRDFKVGDKVVIKYKGIKAIGKVVSIYNNGETVNIEWDNKRTAFYYKNVKAAE